MENHALFDDWKKWLFSVYVIEGKTSRPYFELKNGHEIFVHKHAKNVLLPSILVLKGVVCKSVDKWKSVRLIFGGSVV